MPSVDPNNSDAMGVVSPEQYDAHMAELEKQNKAPPLAGEAIPDANAGADAGGSPSGSPENGLYKPKANLPPWLDDIVNTELSQYLNAGAGFINSPVVQRAFGRRLGGVARVASFLTPIVTSGARAVDLGMMSANDTEDLLGGQLGGVAPALADAGARLGGRGLGSFTTAAAEPRRRSLGLPGEVNARGPAPRGQYITPQASFGDDVTRVFSPITVPFSATGSLADRLRYIAQTARERAAQAAPIARERFAMGARDFNSRDTFSDQPAWSILRRLKSENSATNVLSTTGVLGAVAYGAKNAEGIAGLQSKAAQENQNIGIDPTDAGAQSTRISTMSRNNIQNLVNRMSPRFAGYKQDIIDPAKAKIAKSDSGALELATPEEARRQGFSDPRAPQR